MIDRRKFIPLFASLGITALILTLAMICFYNLDKLTDATQTVFGYGLMFILTLCKPVLIAYAISAAIYVATALVMGLTAKTAFTLKFSLIITAILGVFFLVAQPLLWIIASKSPVLVVATLLSEITYIVNFAFIKKAYSSVYGKK